MPSRTRIVLRRDGLDATTNENAKYLITSLVAEGIIWKTGLPEGWSKLKLRGRLEYLKTLLPPEWVLEVYTEPRATRPTKSVYKSQFVVEGQKRKRKVKRAPERMDDFIVVPVDPQPPQNQQVGGREYRIAVPPGANWVADAFFNPNPPGVVRRRP